MTTMLGWTILAAVTVGGPQGNTSPARSQAAAQPQVHMAQCQVFLIDDVQVPAQESGTLVSLQVQEGAQVRAEQLLGQVDDRKAQLAKMAAERERDAALARATEDIEIRYAAASLEVAQAELSQSEDINRRSAGSVSAAELRRLHLTCRQAELQIDRSRLDRRVAQMNAQVHETEVASAEESILRRRIMAPFDGMVVEVLRHQSEWVNAGEPVLRLIRLDRLRVEGFVSTRQLNPEDVSGCPVTVEIERAGGSKVQLRGQIVYVSPLVQAGDKYRVRAEVQNGLIGNHWVLRPGMSAGMTIQRATGELAARPQPTPARQPTAPSRGNGVRR